MRNEKRYQDIDEVLAAGIDVISTVNIQHLESLNDAIAELTDVKVRETFPDRILEEADEVVLVDLTPAELQDRLRAGKVYPRERAEVALQNFFRVERLSALRELALREVAEDVEARRQTLVLDPRSQQAVAERVLVLVTPEPRSQRILRRAWRSAERLGAQLDALWVRNPAKQLSEEEQVSLAALRRLAIVLGAHFLEEEGDELVATVRRVRLRARLDVRLRRHAGREPPPRDPARLARLRARPRAAGGRHPRRREPGRPAGGGAVSPLDFVAARRSRRRSRPRSPSSLLRRRPPKRLPVSASARRILVPFAGRLDETVLSAAIRIARAEEAVLVPAYLLIVPLRYDEDSPVKDEVKIAMPLLEAVEHAALRAGVAVDARIEKGRTLTHALRRLWEVEQFDRIVAPAPVNGGGGFTEKELAWLLANAPTETLVLKPTPTGPPRIRSTRRAA